MNPADVVFKCPTDKCAYAIASDDLNEVKLQVLRRLAKTCPECGIRAKFTEQTSLPNIQTKTSTSYGGTQYEKLSKKDIRRNRNSARRQKRAADRGA